MLISFLALVALVNMGLSYVGTSLQGIVGWAMAPVAYLLGVPWEDCKAIGKLLGTRTVLNELIAYKDLGTLKAQNILIDRSVVIASFALCGFANFSSIGIQLGGIGSLVPSAGTTGAARHASVVRGDPGQLPLGLHRGNSLMTPIASPPPDLRTRADEAAAVLRDASAEPPRLAVVLGSGLNELADRLADATIVPYDKVPHFPPTTVAGHEGKVLLGTLGGVRTVVFQGRFHYYEGHDLETVTFPVRVLQQLGASTLILTAATGGIHADLKAGSLVVLTDHLNLLGSNPLRGANHPRLGTRFPDMTEVYSRRLREIAQGEGKKLGIDLVPGVYACLPGPSYETPAEIKMLRTLGGDVVGMSTVPEAIVARHAGIEVLAFALVSNAAAGVTGAPITHEEVLAAGRKAAPRLALLIERVATRLAAADEMTS